jgi:UDP:flavonoid glycosyltransferase YjiC (YdhE family)
LIGKSDPGPAAEWQHHPPAFRTRSRFPRQRTRSTAIAKRKVLFVAEGATLAHVARPWVLARALDPAHFDVTFARPTAYAWLTTDEPVHTRELWCQDPAIFALRLERGQPLYDLQTLVRYVGDDLALLDSEQPDVVIGDFRLSLSVSARLRRIPYITLCDAYWSPERPLRAPLPVLGFTRFIPIPLAALVFRSVAGIALRMHALPMERLRRRYGLASLGFDLRRCYTDADLRLFANFPALFPDVRTSPGADFIGPIAWSPAARDDLDFLDREGPPLIYVTMGSSGDPAVLATLLPILEASDRRIAIATAGRPVPALRPSNRTFMFDYLPGDLVCRHARLVICNGGSPTTNQALAHGVPVLGIARNMDQFLNMQAISDFGAGLLVRADRADESHLRSCITALLDQPRYAERARILAQTARPGELGTRLTGFVDRLCPGAGARHVFPGVDHAATAGRDHTHPKARAP